MSARDDLVAAMEAQVSRHEHFDDSQDYRRLCRAEREAATRFLRDHGKHLLALLDAEPTLEEVLAELAEYGIVHFDAVQYDLSSSGVSCWVTSRSSGWTIETPGTGDTPLQAARECLRRVKE